MVTGSKRTALDLLWLGLGEQTLTVVAEDAAGNVSEEQVTFTVEATTAAIERVDTARRNLRAFDQQVEALDDEQITAAAARLMAQDSAAVQDSLLQQDERG